MTRPKNDSGQNCFASEQRPLFSLCSFLSTCPCLFLVETSVGTVVCTSARSPTVFRPVSRFAAIDARVRIHITRAKTFRMMTFSFTLALALSKRVHFHSVGICCVLRVVSRGSKIVCGVTPLQQRVSKRGAVGVCTQMQIVSEVRRGHVHHHRVLHCVCERGAGDAFKFSDVQLPSSQVWFESSWVFAPGFCWCNDLLHGGELSVLRVRRISAVYETPCHCSVGFFHRADNGFHAALRDQSQRVVDLSTAIRVLVSRELSPPATRSDSSRSHTCPASVAKMD